MIKETVEIIVNDKVMATCHRKKHRTILEVGGYEFKNAREDKRTNKRTFMRNVYWLDINNIFFLVDQEKSESLHTPHLIRAELHEDGTVSSDDLPLNHAPVSELHKYYKEHNLELY